MRVAIVLRLAFVFGIICLVLFGCKTTKVSTTKTVSTATDTVRIKEVIYVKDSSHTTAPVNANIQLGNPCDSMGRLLKYYQSIKVGNDSVTIDTRSGSLVVSANKEASISNNNIRFQAKDSNSISNNNLTNTIIEKQVIVETKCPWWLVVYAIVVTLFSLFMTYLFFSTLFTKIR